jgi:hypothetical protein
MVPGYGAAAALDLLSPMRPGDWLPCEEAALQHDGIRREDQRHSPGAAPGLVSRKRAGDAVAAVKSSASDTDYAKLRS